MLDLRISGGVRGGRGVTQVEVPTLAVPVWMVLSI